MNIIKEKNMTGVVGYTELKKPSVRIFHLAIVLILILHIVVFLLPLLWLILSAFKSTKEFLQIPPTLWPEKFHWEYIPKVWNRCKFGRAYINTALLAAGSCFFNITFNGLTGYVLSRLKPKGSAIVNTIIFWMLLLPSGMSTVPLYMTFTNFPILHISLNNTFWPFWLPAMFNCFNILLFKSFFNGISTTYLEAARIDGCGNLRAFIKIILPLSKPIVITQIVFGINGSMNNFFFPLLLLTRDELKPIALKLYALKGQLVENEYLLALLIVTAIASVIFLIFQKYIMQGMNLGGIKE